MELKTVKIILAIIAIFMGIILTSIEIIAEYQRIELEKKEAEEKTKQRELDRYNAKIKIENAKKELELKELEIEEQSMLIDNLKEKQILSDLESIKSRLLDCDMLSDEFQISLRYAKDSIELFHNITMSELFISELRESAFNCDKPELRPMQLSYLGALFALLTVLILAILTIIRLHIFPAKTIDN